VRALTREVHFQCSEPIDGKQHSIGGGDRHLLLMVKGIEATQSWAKGGSTTEGLCKIEAIN